MRTCDIDDKAETTEGRCREAYINVVEPPMRMDRMRSSATAAYVYTTTSCDSRRFKSSGSTETSCSFVSYRRQ